MGIRKVMKLLSNLIYPQRFKLEQLHSCTIKQILDEEKLKTCQFG